MKITVRGKGEKTRDETNLFASESEKARENDFKWGSINPILIPKTDLNFVSNMKFNEMKEKKKGLITF